MSYSILLIKRICHCSHLSQEPRYTFSCLNHLINLNQCSLHFQLFSQYNFHLFDLRFAYMINDGTWIYISIFYLWFLLMTLVTRLSRYFVLNFMKLFHINCRCQVSNKTSGPIITFDFL